jgi:hypothetical protein
MPGKSYNPIRPEGTAEPGKQGRPDPFNADAFGLAFQPSLRDSRDWRGVPRVKTRGYYQVSLRDSCGQRFEGSRKDNCRGMGARAYRPKFEEFCHTPFSS